MDINLFSALIILHESDVLLVLGLELINLPDKVLLYYTSSLLDDYSNKAMELFTKFVNKMLSEIGARILKTGKVKS
ncbi:hypothetical protein D3C76_1244400 [compost metagenome]|uniref:Uncharacterized protein n=1 Tax=Paenibacillus illinoisensis TaxID=59845 RepID=A0A2W0CCN8_9BACL|nr:hypothetical protein PIL02S_04585 [Paenibacillus illinoisensis]